jgi:subtilisin family serine protease
VHKQYALLAATSFVLAACSDSTIPSGPSRLAPVADVGASIQSQLVPNEYIVALRGASVGTAQLSAQAQSMAVPAGAQVIAVFGAAINGFAVKADAAAIAAIRANGLVEYVEPVQVFTKIATQTPTPSWGLDRIDQRNLPLDNSFTYPTGGAAVHAYIIDTGLLTTHNDFTGRVGTSSNHILPAGGTPAWTDCDGHGTHVTGTIGGTTYGIMKAATVHAVRVLDCFGSGTTTSVVNGINWVITNAVQPAVSNMSLGGGASTALDNATNNMVAAGVVSAVAAGNSAANACNFSPSRAANALTVGSTTITDARSSFSNFGTCVDIFAPGSSIVSNYIPLNNSTATLSGTSMASPHVAGAAALYRSLNPSATAAQTATALINNATAGVVTNPGTGSPNRLLYMGFISGGPPNQLPNANFTFVCAPQGQNAFRCDLDGSTSTDPDGTIASYAWTSPGKPNKSGVTSFYAWDSPGTKTVTLTVTDNAGGTNSETQQIVVGGPPPTNLPPLADFTYACTAHGAQGFRCDLDASTSSDPDGTIVSYAWSSAGKPNKTGVTSFYAWDSAGSRPVTLVVTDNNGATHTKTINVVSP